MEEAKEYKQYLKDLKEIKAKGDLEKAVSKRKAMEASTLEKYISKAPAVKAFDDATKPFLERRLNLSGFGSIKEAAKTVGKRSAVGKILVGAGALGAAGKAIKDKYFSDSDQGAEDVEKKSKGGMNKYSTGKSVKLSSKQMKIARMAPPPNKITGEDFKAMKANVGKSVKGYGQARTSGMGLEDENVSLGKGSDYIKDLL